MSQSNEGKQYLPQTEFGWRLVAAAVAWVSLCYICSFVIGFLIGLIGALYHVPKSSTVIIEAYVGPFSLVGVLSAAAIIGGRIVGSGNVNAGLGNRPVSRLPIIACLAIVAVAYAILLHFIVPGSKVNETGRILLAMGRWEVLVTFLLIVVIGPAVEESLWRGWLWTGLQRQWGVMPTALLTSTFWLAMHFLHPIRPIALIPVAIILAVARHFGQSMRAPLALHIIYNLAAISAP